MDNLSLISRKKFTMDKFLSEVKIETNKEIKTVLSFEAKSIITSKEIFGGVVSIVGKLAVNMVYLTAENEIESAREEVDFSEKQKVSFALSDLFAKDNFEISLAGVNFGDALFVVSHSISVSGNYSYEFPVIADDEQNLVVKRKTFNANKWVKSVEESFVVAEECEISANDPKVLSAVSHICYVEASPAVDKVVLEGKLFAEVMLLEENTIKNVLKEFEFRQEMALEGTIPSMNSSVETEIVNITVTPENKDNKTTLVFAVDVYAKAHTYDETSVEVVADMFSLESQIQTTYDYARLKNYSKTIFATESVSSLTEISHIAELEDICTVSGADIVIKSVENYDEKIEIIAEIQADAIYETQDGMGCIKIKKEFSLNVAKDTNLSAGNVRLSAMVQNFKVKAGKELEVSFGVNYLIDIETELEEEFVKNFEIKEERTNKFSGIKVYITKEGETLFDVARIIGVRPEVISSQNQCDDCFKQGEKIYVYSPINLM